MTQLLWLSFTDPDRPEGERHLGSCIVEIDDDDLDTARSEVAANIPHAKPGSVLIWAATRKAHEMGCNPGGEVLMSDITETDDPNLLALKHNRLYARRELEKAGVIEKGE